MAWQSGGAAGIPGLTSDGSNGIDVAGTATVNGAFTAGDPVNGQLSTFNGNALFNPPIAPFGAPILEVDQLAPVPPLGDHGESALLVVRDASGGLPLTGPIVQIQSHDNASTGEVLKYFSFSGTGDIALNRHGGIGMFSADGGSAPRTLAQATITAITDANAKTAVQALANALADMGALTLT